MSVSVFDLFSSDNYVARVIKGSKELAKYNVTKLPMNTALKNRGIQLLNLVYTPVYEGDYQDIKLIIAEELSESSPSDNSDVRIIKVKKFSDDGSQEDYNVFFENEPVPENGGVKYVKKDNMIEKNIIRKTGGIVYSIIYEPVEEKIEVESIFRRPFHIVVWTAVVLSLLLLVYLLYKWSDIKVGDPPSTLPKLLLFILILGIFATSVTGMSLYLANIWK